MCSFAKSSVEIFKLRHCPKFDGTRRERGRRHGDEHPFPPKADIGRTEVRIAGKPLPSPRGGFGALGQGVPLASPPDRPDARRVGIFKIATKAPSVEIGRWDPFRRSPRGVWKRYARLLALVQPQNVAVLEQISVETRITLVLHGRSSLPISDNVNDACTGNCDVNGDDQQCAGRDRRATRSVRWVVRIIDGGRND